MNIGQNVKISDGASEWMKARYYWHRDMGDTIDGLSGVIVYDYSNLNGDDCHFAIDMGDIGIIGCILSF